MARDIFSFLILRNEIYIFFFNYRLRIYRKRDYTREKEFEFSTIDFVSKVQVGKVETVEN